jgi:PTH1 family peptidyl-tRNA hydrolase
MRIIVGLGNPGREYESSRHNVGWRVIDCLARRWGIDMTRERFEGQFGDGQIHSERVGLLKPLTYMNRSGRSALSAVQFFKIAADAFLVVTDDFALPLGRLRMRPKGSAGGHNGLADLIDRLGTDGFARLRVGIGSPAGSSVTHVLGRFTPQERDAVERAVDRAADAVECWVSDGVETSMNRFNPATDDQA